MKHNDNANVQQISDDSSSESDTKQLNEEPDYHLAFTGIGSTEQVPDNDNVLEQLLRDHKEIRREELFKYKGLSISILLLIIGISWMSIGNHFWVSENGYMKYSDRYKIWTNTAITDTLQDYMPAMGDEIPIQETHKSKIENITIKDSYSNGHPSLLNQEKVIVKSEIYDTLSSNYLTNNQDKISLVFINDRPKDTTSTIETLTTDITNTFTNVLQGESNKFIIIENNTQNYSWKINDRIDDKDTLSTRIRFHNNSTARISIQITNYYENTGNDIFGDKTEKFFVVSLKLHDNVGKRIIFAEEIDSKQDPNYKNTCYIPNVPLTGQSKAMKEAIKRTACKMAVLLTEKKDDIALKLRSK